MSSEANMVRIPKLPDPSIARIPKCARCRNHGIDCELKGHKEKCKFKNCACRSCLVVVERQKVTATRVAHLRHQRKLAVKRGTETPDFRNRNPLTEEEELILSRHLQNKSAEEKEYGSRGAGYPQSKTIERQIERHERYSEVIPPFASTKACMLLREAQNAYSYFYGKPYYPDEKDERSSDNGHPVSVKHHEDKYYRDRDNHSVSYSKTFKTVCSRDGHHDATLHAKCTDRAIIAPRVMRLDENQYYSEYFKSTSARGDYYYEQKMSVHNPPPPLYKYERSSSSSSSSSSSCHNVSIAHSHRLIEPLKVNNGMDKEGSGTHACEQVVPSTHHHHNHNNNNNNNTHSNNNNNNNSSHNLDKRLEVLVVMFPEMKESRLKEVLRQHNSDIQSTVQYLLKLKNSPLDGAPPPCPRSGSGGGGSGGMNYPSYGSNTVKRSDSFSDISRSPQATYSVDEVIQKSDSCTPDGSEVSAFTAVRRKCAR